MTPLPTLRRFVSRGSCRGHGISGCRNYAKPVGDPFPFPSPPRREAPSRPAPRPPPVPPKPPGPLPAQPIDPSKLKLPPGTHARTRTPALAYQHLMKRPTDGMRSPFADESIQVSSEWKNVYYTCSSAAFPQATAEKLQVSVTISDIELRGSLVYLKRERYVDILDSAFGIGNWALIPRGPITLSGRTISRPYALVADGRYISEARGEWTPKGNTFPPNPAQNPEVNSEMEYAALVRCCKDLGVAYELWDPQRSAELRKAVQGKTAGKA